MSTPFLLQEVPSHVNLREKTAMTRCEQAIFACLLLLLLVYVELFCSERPYGTIRSPLLRGDNTSTYPPNIYIGLSYATITHADVTRQLNPTETLVQISSVVVMANLAVCILLVAFRINHGTQRYSVYYSFHNTGNNSVVTESFIRYFFASNMHKAGV